MKWPWVKRILAGLVLLGALAICVLWMMVQHIPSWYRPVHVPRHDDSVDRIWNDLLRTQEVLALWMVNTDEPFEHTFTQDQINAWLAIREDKWPLAREWLPPEVSDPFLHINEHGFRVAVTYREGQLRTVLNLGLRVEADEHRIHAQVLDVAAGSLSVGAGWFRDELADLDRDRWPAGDTFKYQLGDRPLPKLTDLLTGADFPNGLLESWDVKRPFRITRIRCEPGKAVVTFEPLPREMAGM